MADPQEEGEIQPWLPPSTLALDFFPLHQRNKREIQGKHIKLTAHSRMSELDLPHDVAPPYQTFGPTTGAGAYELKSPNKCISYKRIKMQKNIRLNDMGNLRDLKRSQNVFFVQTL